MLKRLSNNSKVKNPKMDKTRSNHSSTTDDSDGNENQKKHKPASSATATAKKTFSPFLSLDASMKDKTLQVFKSDRFVCIRDKYPKARVHLLLIPLVSISNGVKLLKVQDLLKLKDSLDILKEMKQLARKIVDEHVPAEFKSKMQLGFHSIQSMAPLHMHIISTDFVSDCLKHKKHWNSFTSAYFVHLDALINEGEYNFAKDEFNLNKPSVLKGYLEANLKCNVCGLVINNMPNLKKHQLSHFK
jgi:aprataxin